MNRLFQVTVYTGQQLVLEALQRWLQRPCAEPEGQRQRRASVKSLVVLLLKTAATGVLATILDAAIEYRRRQLLSAADDDPSGTDADAAGRSSRFGLGPLSRAGIAAWKAKLLLAIDEMERQAQQYGIEPTRRFAPALTAGTAAEKTDGNGKGDEADEESSTAAGGDRQAALTATVEQLKALARGAGEGGSADADRAFDERVESLLDTLLGDESSATQILVSEGLKASASAARLAPSRSGAELADPAPPDSPGSSCSEDAASDAVCHICMDRAVGVAVAGCRHPLCFRCARRLCAAGDHALPQCPFCRQPIDGFSAYAPAP